MIWLLPIVPNPLLHSPAGMLDRRLTARLTKRDNLLMERWRLVVEEPNQPTARKHHSILSE
jgi:hypothetical protein